MDSGTDSMEGREDRIATGFSPGLEFQSSERAPSSHTWLITLEDATRVVGKLRQRNREDIVVVGGKSGSEVIWMRVVFGPAFRAYRTALCVKPAVKANDRERPPA